MRHKYIVGICLFSCLLLSSTAFINCVQANEVEKAVEEKQESIRNSILSKVPELSAIDYLDIMIIILKIVWFFCYILSCDLIWYFFNPWWSLNEPNIITVIACILGAFPLSFVMVVIFFYDLITDPINTIITAYEFIISFFETIIDLIIFIINGITDFILGKIFDFIWEFIDFLNEIFPYEQEYHLSYGNINRSKI